MNNNFYVGQSVNVPFMVDAYGTIKIVPGVIARIYNTFVSVELTGSYNGYSIGVNRNQIMEVTA